jgi:hypothetical protein
MSSLYSDAVADTHVAVISNTKASSRAAQTARDLAQAALSHKVRLCNARTLCEVLRFAQDDLILSLIEITATVVLFTFLDLISSHR